ncbi:MAG: apolipoprotein N-acyltransferase, partial [Leptospira bouyouniensis]
LVGALVFFLVLVVFFGNGYYLFQKWEKVKPITERDVLIIQPNAPLEFRDGRNPAEEIRNLMTRIDRMVEKELKDKPADLVVLPESGVPFFTTHDSEVTRAIRIYWHQFESLMAIISLRHGTNLFFNELDADIPAEKLSGRIIRNDIRTYNSSVVMNPNGERKNSYQKVFLLIFGEYMPFEWMYALSGQTGQFAPGTKLDLIPYYEVRKTPNLAAVQKDLHWEDTFVMSPNSVRDHYKGNRIEEKVIGSFLPLICYEVIISEFVRKFNGDPDFIVNVTNDKWYGNSVESFQHHTLGRLRSIEFRKWMVRSTNSGTSVFTDHLGRNIDNEFTPIESTATIRKKVSVIPGEMTFYRLYGNLLSYLYMGIVGIVFLIYVKKNS